MNCSPKIRSLALVVYDTFQNRGQAPPRTGIPRLRVLRSPCPAQENNCAGNPSPTSLLTTCSPPADIHLLTPKLESSVQVVHRDELKQPWARSAFSSHTASTSTPSRAGSAPTADRSQRTTLAEVRRDSLIELGLDFLFIFFWLTINDSRSVNCATRAVLTGGAQASSPARSASSACSSCSQSTT